MSSYRSSEIDSRVRPRSFLGLPSEDVLRWLDHFENIAAYRQWSDERKAHEIRTLFEDMAATWYSQQTKEVTENWQILRTLLIQHFTYQNITQTALQQLKDLKQQQNEPMAQFVIRITQLLHRADPNMSEDMKLHFLWPRLRVDISLRTQEQAPLTFNTAINIAQRVERAHSSTHIPIPATVFLPSPISFDNNLVPMDVVIQNLQQRPTYTRQQFNRQPQRKLPMRDAQGRLLRI